jgi:hypothetical protein
MAQSFQPIVEAIIQNKEDPGSYIQNFCRCSMGILEEFYNKE